MIYAGDTLIQKLNEITSEIKFNGDFNGCEVLWLTVSLDNGRLWKYSGSLEYEKFKFIVTME
jgi:hypothetical protein